MHPAFCRLYSYQSGNGVVYAAAGGGTGNFTYQWYSFTDEEFSSNTTWGGQNPGDYQITVVDGNGCILQEVVTIDSVSPIADFTVLSAQLDENLEGTAVVCAEFTNASENYQNIENPFDVTPTFFWFLGYDVGPNNGWQISHDFLQVEDTCFYSEGEYEVCLVAINKNGCKDTSCVTIIVHDKPEFTPPNVFTPGTDAVNNVFTFEFRSQAVSEFQAVVVDRWGVKVAEFTSINDSWDGNFRTVTPKI